MTIKFLEVLGQGNQIVLVNIEDIVLVSQEELGTTIYLRSFMNQETLKAYVLNSVSSVINAIDNPDPDGKVTYCEL